MIRETTFYELPDGARFNWGHGLLDPQLDYSCHKLDTYHWQSSSGVGDIRHSARVKVTWQGTFYDANDALGGIIERVAPVLSAAAEPQTKPTPLSEKIKALATSTATDEDRLQVLIHLVAELAEKTERTEAR